MSLKAITRAYRFLNLVSFDIAVGAVICSLFFTRIFEVQIVPFGLLALGLTVWIIYTIDHLIDARLMTGAASMERHRFHQAHFRKILVCLFIAMIADVAFLFFMRGTMVKAGLILSALVVVYLVANRYLKFLKEFTGAMLYTFGVMIPTVATSAIELNIALVLLLFQFFLTAFINLLLFAWFDRDHDLKDKATSFVLSFGERATSYLLVLLFVFQLLILVSQVYIHELYMESLVIFLMNGVLLTIFLSARFFTEGDRYRMAGDLVFIFPMIYLVWHS